MKNPITKRDDFDRHQLNKWSDDDWMDYVPEEDIVGLSLQEAYKILDNDGRFVVDGFDLETRTLTVSNWQLDGTVDKWRAEKVKT